MWSRAINIWSKEKKFTSQEESDAAFKQVKQFIEVPEPHCSYRRNNVIEILIYRLLISPFTTSSMLDILALSPATTNYYYLSKLLGSHKLLSMKSLDHHLYQSLTEISKFEGYNTRSYLECLFRHPKVNPVLIAIYYNDKHYTHTFRSFKALNRAIFKNKALPLEFRVLFYGTAKDYKQVEEWWPNLDKTKILSFLDTCGNLISADHLQLLKYKCKE